MVNWILSLLIVSTVVLAGEFKEGEKNSTECFYCVRGNLSDFLRLFDVYGNSELKLDGFASRIEHEDCGINGKQLKKITCPYGCMIAEYTNHNATFAGCARDGVKAQGTSTHTFNKDQELKMSPCSVDECNESFESAKENRPKTTSAPATVSVNETVLEVNGTVKPNETVDKKVTPKPMKKPNSAASVGASTCALFLGLLAYAYAL